MQITIRKGVENDYPQIHGLIKEFAVFQGSTEKVTITVDQMIKDKAIFQCYIAEIDQDIIGFTSFFFAYYSWTGKALYIDDLYVAESCRKQGVGKMLFQKMISHAKAEHCKKLRWQVSNWNSKAIEFYKKMGATIDEVEINCEIILQ